MERESLKRLYTLAHRAVTLNLDGVGDEEGLRTPEGGGNCINWIVGHLVATRSHALRAVGEAPIWDRETAAPYTGEEGAEFMPRDALPLERIRADLDRSQEMLVSGLDRASEETLAQTLEGGGGVREGQTVGELLAFLQFHEAYHAGQIGLARRLVGLPGVIKPPKPPSPS